MGFSAPRSRSMVQAVPSKPPGRQGLLKKPRLRLTPKQALDAMGKAAVLAMKTKSRLSPRRYQSSTHLSFGLVWSSGCSCAPSAQERRGCLASSSVAYSASRGPRKLMPPGILGRDHQSRSLVRFNRTSPVRKNDWPRAPALTSPCAPGHIA